eukprot:1758420-Amphidinium_carterae.3
MPSDAGLTLNKSVNISAEAVRNTVGEEREFERRRRGTKLAASRDRISASQTCSGLEAGGERIQTKG